MKSCSLCTFARQRPILTSAAVIMTTLIISALAIGGYYSYLYSHQPSSTTHTTSYTVNDLATESSAEPTTNVEPITSSETTTGSTNEPEHYTYFTRSEWSLITNDFTNLTTPIKRVIIAHTVTYPCVTNCSLTLRTIQNGHINAGSVDIKLNFLIGGDGNVYEGIGYNVGNHSRPEYNDNSICISFVGNYSDFYAPDVQIRTAKQFIYDNVENEKVHSDYALYAHSLVFATLSPGKYLYEQIQSWDNFKYIVIPL